MVGVALGDMAAKPGRVVVAALRRDIRTGWANDFTSTTLDNSGDVRFGDAAGRR
jgi:hypothetical protein